MESARGSINQTVLNEFYRVFFRKEIYNDLESLQADLDDFMVKYNNERTHQGKRCKGNTPCRHSSMGNSSLQRRI